MGTQEKGEWIFVFLSLRWYVLGPGGRKWKSKMEVAEPPGQKLTHFSPLKKVVSSDSYFLTVKTQSGAQSLTAWSRSGIFSG